MGAAPVLSAAPLLQQKGYTIPGVIVLDVVEGASPPASLALATWATANHAHRDGRRGTPSDEVYSEQETGIVPLGH